MIKKFLLILFLLIGMPIFAEEVHTLQAGVSMVEKVPNTFFGSWRVVANMDKSTGSTYFKPQSVDFWNLSRVGNVINLCNPFTGAEASVTVDYVEGNMIRFTRVGNYDNRKLTDTVDLKLDGNRFTGINSITLETYSYIDKSLLKKDTAVYILKGEKISGSSIVEGK